jgi:L-rhamnose mutarotase
MAARNVLATVITALVALSLVACGCTTVRVQRHGLVIGIENKDIDEFKRLYADVRPDVLEVMRGAKMYNCSIYLGEVAENRYYLLGYYEYIGRSYKADMARMAKDKATQDWLRQTERLLRPLQTREQGQSWAIWEEVFHHDGPSYDKSWVKSRHASIIGMLEKDILAYTQMHAAVWPGVLAAIDRANIRNYSIYLGQIEPGEYLLFSYFEYIGDDFKGDMGRVADEVTKTWWSYTDPLQVRLPGTPQGEQWKQMEEVFHTD